MPLTLAAIGRRLLMRGQFVAELQVRAGVVHLVEAQQWDVTGGSSPDSWQWELTFDGPSRQDRRTLGASRVLNLVYATDPNRPWSGTGPINAAGITQGLLTHSETRLAQEANAAAGNIVPIPDTAQAGTLQDDLRRADGRLLLVDSTADWGDGAENRPGGDWQPRRLGQQPAPGCNRAKGGCRAFHPGGGWRSGVCTLRIRWDKSAGGLPALPSFNHDALGEIGSFPA